MTQFYAQLTLMIYLSWSLQPFLPMLAFTVTFKTVLQDSYFRAPGAPYSCFYPDPHSLSLVHSLGSTYMMTQDG
jgi:hypothetical protein